MSGFVRVRLSVTPLAPRSRSSLRDLARVPTYSAGCVRSLLAHAPLVLALNLLLACSFDLTVIPMGERDTDHDASEPVSPAPGSDASMPDQVPLDAGEDAQQTPDANGLPHPIDADASLDDSGTSVPALPHGAIIARGVEEFMQRWQAVSQGACIEDFETYEEGADRYYVALPIASSQPCRITLGRSLDDLTSERDQARADGMELTDIETYELDHVRYYAGVFQGGRVASTVISGATWQQFHSGWVAGEQRGERLLDFETYQQAEGRAYVGLLTAESFDSMAWVKSPWDDFHTHWKQFELDGYRIYDLEVHEEGGVLLYSGLFRKGLPYWGAWVDQSWEEFEAKWRALEADGQRLYDFETYLSPGGTRLYTGLFRPYQAPKASAP